MGLETEILKQVKKDVLEKHSKTICPYFTQGTLWVIESDNEISETVHKSIVNFFGDRDIKVIKTKLKPSEIQPYTEYAFDF